MGIQVIIGVFSTCHISGGAKLNCDEYKASKFLSSLEYIWNKFLSKDKFKNVKVIVCGSSASWMIKNIINNKGGLHNRINGTIKLMPFSLNEVEEYLLNRNINFDRKQIIELYMIIGGIPKYWSYIGKTLSIPQLNDALVFDKDGFLYQEFDRLYSSLFDDYTKHLSIIKTLAKHPQGLSQDRLLREAKLSLCLAKSFNELAFFQVLQFWHFEFPILFLVNLIEFASHPFSFAAF